MTREEFKTIVKGLKAIYTDPKFIADLFAFDMWYAVLGDLTYEEASLASQRYIQSQSYQPMPADIRRYVVKNQESEENEISELEAWNMVFKASHNGLTGSKEEFAKLPKAVQIALGNHVSLREMASMEIETLVSVEKSHFIRNYRATLEKMRSERQLSNKLNQDIKALKQESNPAPSIETVKTTPALKGETIPEPEAKSGLTESVQTALDEMLGRTQKCG